MYYVSDLIYTRNGFVDDKCTPQNNVYKFILILCFTLLFILSSVSIQYNKYNDFNKSQKQEEQEVGQRTSIKFKRLSFNHISLHLLESTNRIIL